jgi:hypothetical protein
MRVISPGIRRASLERYHRIPIPGCQSERNLDMYSVLLF